MRRVLLPVGIVLILVGSAIFVARVTATHIDGIGCDFVEGSGYHVHAHLTIVYRGHVLYPPGNIGFRYEHLCLYWVHTHDDSGIIHIEAPHPIFPSLRAFFDIWGQPLSRQQLWRYEIGGREALIAYVGLHQYMGDPGRILLRRHTTVTLEIGPPYIPPPPVDFRGY